MGTNKTREPLMDTNGQEEYATCIVRLFFEPLMDTNGHEWTKAGGNHEKHERHEKEKRGRE